MTRALPVPGKPRNPTGQALPCNYAALLGAVFDVDPVAILEKQGLSTESFKSRTMGRLCDECGAVIAGYRPEARAFCDRACQAKWTYRDCRIDLACEECGELFKRRAAVVVELMGRRGQDHVWCSKRCHGLWLGRTHGFTAHPENTRLGGRRRRD